MRKKRQLKFRPRHGGTDLRIVTGENFQKCYGTGRTSATIPSGAVALFHSTRFFSSAGNSTNYRTIGDKASPGATASMRPRLFSCHFLTRGVGFPRCRSPPLKSEPQHKSDFRRFNPCRRTTVIYTSTASPSR